MSRRELSATAVVWIVHALSTNGFLQYDDGGRIVERLRALPGGTGHFATEFAYDEANRLLSEVNKTSGGTFRSSRSYAYDAAGNRSSMTVDNHLSDTLTTTYYYGNRNQMTSHTGHWPEGTSYPWGVVRAFDEKGNLWYSDDENGHTLYTWTEDDRLASVHHDDESVVVELVSYAYDHAGRRLLRRRTAMAPARGTSSRG